VNQTTANPLVEFIQAESKPDAVRPLTRAEVRQFVSWQMEHLRQYAADGGNGHQLALDYADQIEAYGALLGESDQAVFARLFSEEAQAATAHANAEHEQAVVQQVQKSSAGLAVWSTVSAILIMVFITIILRSC
jgi:hypothetical protein